MNSDVAILLSALIFSVVFPPVAVWWAVWRHEK